MSKKEAEKANQELIASLKFRVKELEHEVGTLKGRLDDLRKAKNTTITKREREVVEVGFKRDPRYEAQLAELEKKVQEVTSAKNREIEDLKKKHAAEIDDLKKKHSAELQTASQKEMDMRKELAELRNKLVADMKQMEQRLSKQNKDNACNHEGELYQMKIRIQELEGDNGALKLENSELRERVNSLVTELSVKEAKWCEAEEQYKLKMKQNLGDKYAEWMAETEQKIQDLQEANALLRTYLSRERQRIPPETNR